MKLRKRIDTVVKDDRFSVALWIVGARAVMELVAFLLDQPELREYAQLLNLVSYIAVKTYNNYKK